MPTPPSAETPPKSSAWAPFQWPDFRRLLTAAACATLASRALLVVLGYEVYDLTKIPLALGGLGLVEAIPALSLALYAGHIADRHDRRRILRITLAALVACGIVLTLVEVFTQGTTKLIALFAVVFVAGIAKAFSEPASGALEAQVVPRELLIRSSTVMASVWMTGAVLGALLGGTAYSHIGPAATYFGIAALYAGAWVSITSMAPKPMPLAPEGESVWTSVVTGVRYVAGDQILFGSMALDLFAVLFGGAIAMLSVFASDILHVGSTGLGLLNASPTAGALLALLWANRRPPVEHAGRNLFLSVAGFGVAMIVFALSRSMWLSLAALFFSGVFDGVSVVIRRSILRLMSPNELRGRIAAVSMIFIGSSNEIGAFESGVAASLLGTVRSVWMGGVLTLVVVAAAAIMAPRLRRLRLDPQSAAQPNAEADAGPSAAPFVVGEPGT